MNVAEVFFKNTKDCLDKTAFTLFQGEERKELSYSEVVSSIRRLATYLSERIEKEDRIAICSENRPQWCISYLAIMTVGCIAVPVDAELSEEDIKNILLASQTKIVFCSDKTRDKVSLEGFINVHIVNFDRDFVHIGEKAEIDYDRALSAVSPDDIASLIYTSGTTGVPKGVMLTHKNFCSDAAEVTKTGIVTEKDNVLSVLPLHHTYAFMCTFFVPLIVRGSITYPASLKGPDLAHAIRDAGVTILIGVPQLLDLFYSAIKRNIDALSFVGRSIALTLVKISGFFRSKFDLNLGKIFFKKVHSRFGRQFRIMASGGASLVPATMKGLEAFGFTVLEGYGLTETSPVVTFNPIKKRKPGSVGKPLTNVDIKILMQAEDSQNIEGEIAIKGDMVMKGYYNMPEETERVLKEGWFYTGDLGYIDDEGYLFITGRRKEVIVLPSGKNIYPEEIEKEYQQIPLIRELCVVEKKEGDTISLHGLVLPDFEQAKISKIANIHEALKWDIHDVSLKLPQYMRLKGFTLYSEPLPRTRLGKLKRFMVKDILSSMESKQETPQPMHVEELDSVSKSVLECVQRFVQEGMSVRMKDNLELDLGIDSLKRIELTVELEKTFSLSLSETFMVDIQTVSEICERIKNVLETGKQEQEGEARTFRDLLLAKPSEDQIRQIGLKRGIVVSLFVWIVLKILKIMFKIYFKTQAKGIENIPEQPFILVSNHASYLDSFFIASHIPYKEFNNLFFQGAQKYFENWLMRHFARVAHVIPIDPDSYLTSALSLSAYVLSEGKSLFIFPEGGRSFDGKIMSFRKGIGILSSEYNVPLVPVKIRGTYESMPRGRIFPRRTELSLTIGTPISVKKISEIKERGGDYYQAIADLAQGKVIDL